MIPWQLAHHAIQRYDSEGDRGEKTRLAMNEMARIEGDFRLEFAFRPPTPGGNSHEYQRKRLSEKGVCKLLKIKGRFALELHRDVIGRCVGAIRARIGQDKHNVA
jgi:hypothetical protein